MRSGFGGFNKLSSISTGKRSLIDSFVTLDAAIKSILEDPRVLIYTTAVPSSIEIDSSGLISKWNPLNFYSSNAYLTQSTNTRKPILDSTYLLGKYPGAYFAGAGQLLTGSNNSLPDSTPQVFKKTRRHFTYFTWVQDPVSVALSYLFRATRNVGTSYWVESARVAWNGSNINFAYINYFTSNSSNPNARTMTVNFSSSSARDIFGNLNSNTFRMLEEVYNPNDRSVTSSLYNSNKTLIDPGASNSPVNIVSSNKFSMIFTSGSATTTATNWDTQFPSGSFQTVLPQLGHFSGDAKEYHHTFIQSHTDSPISADTVQNLKNLLDKVYGV